MKSTNDANAAGCDTKVHSKVLYVDKIPFYWTEETLKRNLELYGTFSKVLLLRKRNCFYSAYQESSTQRPISFIQALVQAEDADNAAAFTQLCRQHPIMTEEGEPLLIDFAKVAEIRQPNDTNSSTDSDHRNRILLVTVQNPLYPITADLMASIFSYFGKVEKIVIFEKAIGLQCLIQLSFIEDATAAKKALNGVNIFPDCCCLIIHYSKLSQELVVKTNGPRTWDFTNSNLSNQPDGNEADIALETCEAINKAAFATANMTNSGQEIETLVLFVSNLRESVTCDQLFNLFSCYGNVARVKKFNSKPDHALVQFSTPAFAQSALLHLRGFTLFGRSLEITFSKHAYINVSAGSSKTKSTGMVEYGHSTNRFTGKFAGFSKNINCPTKILHISNLDISSNEEALRAHLLIHANVSNFRLKLFAVKGHSQALADFQSIDMATNTLVSAHNTLLHNRRLRVAFSTQNVSR
uniref:Uncharacterized protein AlNc14C71G4892 n=1 Tax=Albugo laibachii Nc14 TaxID=890382 RepID=F0WE31_9STRA|nr:hypothetical protein SELMODRAFT_173175 [Albugo laibachii Nc14]|eukprot:CCA19460.1 hypothetical protein SELMODRAFT_173175 [Albugo laibachii Nc14]